MPNYSLAERLPKLPHEVVLSIRKDFAALPFGHNSRWSDLMNDKIAYMKVEEAKCFIDNIGCTLDELIKGDFDLTEAYQRKLNQIETESAKHYGLFK